MKHKEAITTSVKLTNTVDRILIERGLLSSRCLRQLEVESVANTSALTLVLPPTLAKQLGLRVVPISIMNVTEEKQTFRSEPVTVECEGRTATVEAFVWGTEVVLGQVVLSLLGLMPDPRGQKLIADGQHNNGWAMYH